jgi:putative oxidoreductase
VPTLSIVVTLLERLVLVMLFLPFSVLDKILNFQGAMKQAAEVSKAAAPFLICAGICVELFGSLCIITGFADRLAALVLAGYCGMTALLWKRFWAPGDFWADGAGRSLFWDFLKNFALGSGFLFITFGTGPADVTGFVQHPFSSSHPYSVVGQS